MPSTTRGAFPYPASTDDPDGAAQIQALADRIAAVGMLYVQVTAADHSDRPSPGTAGRLARCNVHGEVWWDNGTAWSQINTAPVIEFAIPFHVTGPIAAGLKIPKWIAPANATLRSARAMLESGSGAKFRVYVNGASPTGMVDSGTVGTSVVLHDFANVDINAGDRVQLYVANIGSSANDLSVTVDAVWR